MSRRLRAQSAFSLVEMLVAMSLVSVLIAVAAPSLLGNEDKARGANARQLLSVAYQGANAQAAQTGAFPLGADLVDAIEQADGTLAGKVALTGCPDPGHVGIRYSGAARVVLVAALGDPGRLELQAGLDGQNETVQLDGADCDHTVEDAAQDVAAGGPAAQARPLIAGAPHPGSTLRASAGVWSGSPSSFTYAWRRCDSAGRNCQALAGENGDALLLDSADAGQTVRVKVTAFTATAAGASTSAASAVVSVPAPGGVPVALDPPRVAGTPRRGETLTALAGSWSGQDTVTRTWQRCDATASACQTIAGQTAAALHVTVALVGAHIRVVEHATNAQGAAVSASVPVGPVSASGAPVNLTAPTLSGVALQDRQLSAANGTWEPAPSSFTYQWERCDAAGGACADIAGAVAATHVLTYGDVGFTLRAVVRAHNAEGSDVATSAPSALVGQTYTQAVMADGPAGYWPLDSAAGAPSTPDVSGADRTMTVGDGLLGVLSPDPAMGQAGAFGGSLSASMDGVDDRLAVTGVPTVAQDNWTLELWARADAGNQHALLVHNGAPASNGYGLALTGCSNTGTPLLALLVTQGRCLAAWFPGSGGLRQLGVSLADTGWHHLALVRAAGTTRLYVDGVAAPNSFAAAPLAPTSGLYVGYSPALVLFGTMQFDGGVDEAAVYGSALTQAELANHLASAPNGA